jgi:hypothetical protein
VPNMTRPIKVEVSSDDRCSDAVIESGLVPLYEAHICRDGYTTRLVEWNDCIGMDFICTTKKSPRGAECGSLSRAA